MTCSPAYFGFVSVRYPEPGPVEEVTAGMIIKAVEEVMHITNDQIRSKCREQEIVDARHLAMYLLCFHTHLPLKTIGMMLKRDHTTVMHGRDKVSREWEVNGMGHFIRDANRLLTA